MALKDYQRDMMRCTRCPECKWIPLAQVNSHRFSRVCSSISRYNFHTYAGGGRLISGLSILLGRIDYNDNFLNILYRCQMCGACDVSCKCNKDMEPWVISWMAMGNERVQKVGPLCSNVQKLQR